MAIILDNPQEWFLVVKQIPQPTSGGIPFREKIATREEAKSIFDCISSVLLLTDVKLSRFTTRKFHAGLIAQDYKKHVVSPKGTETVVLEDGSEVAAYEVEGVSYSWVEPTATSAYGEWVEGAKIVKVHRCVSSEETYLRRIPENLRELFPFVTMPFATEVTKVEVQTGCIVHMPNIDSLNEIIRRHIGVRFESSYDKLYHLNHGLEDEEPLEISAIII